MKQPLSIILIRIFAYGFFKVHSGQLLFLFVTFISYCFYINTLGTVSLSAMIYAQYLMTIKLVSDPLIMGLFFLVCLLYNIKSWQYVALQLSGREQQFIYYSSNALPWQRQLRSWFFMQLLINAPAFIYSIFALCIGLIWHHYFLPVIIFCYLVVLTLGSALLYLKLANRFIDTPKTSVPLRLMGHWKKPLFSLFIYYIMDKQKIAFVIAKAVNIIIIGSGLLHPNSNDYRFACVGVLLLILSHAILIYQEQHFEQHYLSFMRNFPYGRLRVYLSNTLTHILLLLPEFIWLVGTFHFGTSIGLILLGISITQLLRGICYRYARGIKVFLPALFIMFFVLFWSIMYGMVYWLIPINFIISFLVFYNSYFRQEYYLSGKS